MEASRHVKLSLVCLLSTFAPRSMALAAALDAASSFGLLATRDQNACAADSGLEACPQGINFCCTSGSTCVPTTDDNSSVICCPTGSDCRYIHSIACDVTVFNATTNPLAPLHSSNLDQELPKCGDLCCPFGYQCQNGNCFLFGGQNKTSEGLSTAATGTSPMPIQTLPIPSAPAVAPTVIQTIAASSQNSAFPPGAVALGLCLGLAAGIGATLLGLFLIRRKKQRHEPEIVKSPSFLGTTPKPLGHSYNTSSSSQHTISQPAWAPEYGQSHRTDFLLRRGEAETSYEQSAKPAWSSANEGPEPSITQPSRSHSPSSKITTPERGRTLGSLRSRTNDTPSVTITDTPSSQMSSRKERMPPLFAKPLKFGQDLRPAKSLRSNGQAPTRPPRSDERSPSSRPGTSQRDPSQQRPLIAKDNNPVPTISLARADSDVSAKDHCPEANNNADRESTGTITFLMTPAEIGRGRNRATANTTWSGMLHEIYGDVDHELGKYSAPKK